MSNYYNRQWRLPNAWNGTESNVNKQSNYSMGYDSASSDYIDVGQPSGLGYGTVTTAFSISVWAKTGDWNNKYIFGNRGGGTGANDSGFAFSTSSTYSDYNGLLLRVGNNTNIAAAFNYNELQTNTWTHFVIVYDGSGSTNSDKVKIYKDSTSLSLTFNLGNIPSTITSTLNFAIGAYTWQTGRQGAWDGQIDGVAIYNYALSSSQVTTLYGSSSTGIGNPMSLSPKPVAYYPLGDQDAFNGSSYLTPNASLKDYVFSFDGTNDYINLGTPSTFAFGTGDFTIGGWVYLDSSANYQWLFSTGTNFAFGFSSSRNLQLWVGGTATTPSFNINLNQWHHIVATRNSGTVTFYIDGSAFGTTYSRTGSIAAGSYNYIGTFNVNQNHLDGRISNFQLFNSALPATGSNSIETLYNNGSPLTSMSGFSSLVGSWKLDASATYDGTNWSIPDSSSNSNTGTSSGMTQANLIQSDLSFKTSISPFALDFDGTNDLITISNESNFDFDRTDSFSISCWFKCDDVSANNHIVNKLNSTGDYTGYNLFINNSDSKLWFYLRHNYSSPNQIIIKSDNALVNNVWYNLVVTYDGSSTAAGCKMYIDNVNVSNTESDTLSSSILNNEPLRIGGRSPSTSNFANGSISNVSIWNTNLSASQVSEIYSEGIPQNLLNHSAVSSLVSWWQLGSNSSFNTNWTVLDEVTASGNNGVSANMTEADIVDGVGSSANGVSSGMSDNIVGDAFGSSANSLSYNMDVLDRSTDVPN